MRRCIAAACLALLTGAAPAAGADGPSDLPGIAGRTTLAGPWTVRLDRGGDGGEHGWAAGAFTGTRIAAPYVPNALPVTGAAGIEGFDGAVAWYRTTFSVPADGAYALRFESVNHRADVWLDGDRLGGHVGEYLPFEERFDATAGRHVLVVRADWRDPPAMKRAGWHRTWFNFGGINREVTLRAVASSEVTAPVIRTRLLPSGAARVDISVHVHNTAGVDRSLKVRGTLANTGVVTPVTFLTTLVPAGGWRVVKTHVVIDQPALWSPADPRLYDVELGVPEEGSWTGRTGLRELTWTKAGALRLNGEPLVLRGVSIQEDAKGRGDALTAADMDEIVSDLKYVGANATRSQHPLSPALLDRLDAAGILVWQGVGPVDSPGSWTAKTPAQQRTARERVRQSLNQLQTHPSIIAWNLANEVAGNGHPGGQAAYVDDMARELHRRDPGRLVALDVWGAHAPDPGTLGVMYRNVDAIGVTNYAGWYDATTAPRPQVAGLIRQSAKLFGATFPGKVLIISEFGAEASGANPDLEPGGYGFQTRLLAASIRGYAADPRLAGMMIWALRDFAVAPTFAGGSIRKLVPDIKIVRGLNQKGLFTYGNTAKPAAGMVRRAYLRLRSLEGR